MKAERAGFFKQSMRCMVAIASLYVSLIVMALSISTFYVDERFGHLIDSKMRAAQCEFRGNARSANPLNIADFYFNTHYWLADYRVLSEILDHPVCVSLLLRETEAYGASVRVLVVKGSDPYMTFRRH